MTNPRNDVKISFKIKNSHLDTGWEILIKTETMCRKYHLKKEVSTQDDMKALRKTPPSPPATYTNSNEGTQYTEAVEVSRKNG